MKRYGVNISAYIWAENDDEAREWADKYAKYLDAFPEMADNKASAFALFENTPPQFTGREVAI